MADVIPEDELDIVSEVSQETLIEYLKLQNRVAFMKESIKASLTNGARVERGDLFAKLKTSSRRSPKWKVELEKVVGSAGVKAIMDATPAVEIVSLTVDVDKNAIVQEDGIH